MRAQVGAGPGGLGGARHVRPQERGLLGLSALACLAGLSGCQTLEGGRAAGGCGAQDAWYKAVVPPDPSPYIYSYPVLDLPMLEPC